METMQTMKISKSQLVSKIDAEPVSLDYKPQQGESVFVAYMWGFAPMKFKSRTINQELFDEIC